jgi:hypothetical protein
LAIVRRSYVGNVATDTVVRQADWSLDTMDGSGISGITINSALAQIFYCDLEWLGVGRVRVGFVINGLVYYAHEFLNTNNGLSTVYMSTASLPIRYEQRTVGVVADTETMDCICSAVASEGGHNIKAPIFAISNKETLVSVTNVKRPILSIRVGQYFPASGTVLNRSVVEPLSTAIFSEDAPVYYEVLLNPTLGGESWKAFDIVNSGVQYDVSATGSVGGTVIDAGYVATTNQSKGTALNLLETNLILALNIEGTVGDILTISAVRIGSTSSDCSAIIQWKELY